MNGLLFYVEKYIDPNQFAVSGASCTHALIQIIDFILKHTDYSQIPKAVLSLMADWSKAFNKCNHNIFIKILMDMMVPEWLLRIIVSYLENRKMHIRFRGVTSKERVMPGGAPQGTLLGVIYYLIYINPVGFPAEITQNIEAAMEAMSQHNLPPRQQEEQQLQQMPVLEPELRPVLQGPVQQQPPQPKAPLLPNTMKST